MLLEKMNGTMPRLIDSTTVNPTVMEDGQVLQDGAIPNMGKNKRTFKVSLTYTSRLLTLAPSFNNFFLLIVFLLIMGTH